MKLIGILLLAAFFSSEVAADPPLESTLGNQTKSYQDLEERRLPVKDICFGGVYYFGYCYRFVFYRKNWIDAELHCQRLAQGGHLASIHGMLQNALITRLMIKVKRHRFRAWIGLHDFFKEGTFLWTDGTPTDFTYWFPHEPNNQFRREDCVHIVHSKRNSWNDAPCKRRLPFICSYKMQCDFSYFP
ncbi:C-type lectin mannose-binding isoform-like isoform X3 [Mustelus asterias]